MPTKKTDRILIIDDDFAQAELVIRFLNQSGYPNTTHTTTICELWSRLESQTFDILLLDYRLPDGTGLEVLQELKEKNISIPVIMITGQGDERIAVQAIQQGAADYLIKSGDYLLTLPSLIQKTIQNHQLQHSVQASLAQIRYQAFLLDNVQDAIVVWDLSGRITYWNQAANDLYGFTSEQRLGEQVSEVYWNSFTPPISLPTEAKANPYVVRQYKKADGKTIWVSSRISPLHQTDASNQPMGYMDITHDITGWVQAQEALRKSEARYRAIVEDYQTELICRFKPNGTLTYANKVFCEYFGFKRSELLGMNFLYFVPEKERQILVNHWSSFTTQKKVATLEHQVIQPNKETRWLEHTDRAIFDRQARIYEFQSVGHDTSDKKRLEHQIQAAQSQLIQAARMATIGEIASGVAHQIYNPLTTIIADAQILLRNLGPSAPGRESAQAIEQAGWRLQNVVQRLLAFSEPSADTFERIAINDTIQQAVSLVADQITHAGIQLKLHLAQNLPEFSGNTRKLESLWVYLLLLARDASVEVQGQRIQIISRSLPSKTILVEVRDEGKSIPRDQLANIFEPNFIGAPGGRGSGMELSICREIVRQHGGEISAASTPDHDTIFRVVFPMRANR